MKPKSWIFAGLALLLMGVAGGFLHHQKSTQRLGTPGVKVIAKAIYDEDGALAGTNSVFLPETVPGWESRDLPLQKVVLNWLPKDTTYAQKIYRETNGFGVQMTVVLMGGDRTSIHKPEYCLLAGGWGDHQSEYATIPIAQPHAFNLPVRKMLTSRAEVLPSGESRTLRGIYVYWFVADEELTASHSERMWWMTRDILTSGVLQRWAYASAFAICLPGDEEETYQRMRSLIAQVVPEFQITTGHPVQLAEADPTRERREAGQP